MNGPVDMYHLFDQLAELMKMEDAHYPNGCIRYSKMVQTGQMEVFDYGRGFLFASIYSMPTNNGKFVVRACLSTVDDGGWGAWSNEMSLEKANELATRVKDVFDTVTLPNEWTLNDLLRPFGMFGTNEG